MKMLLLAAMFVSSAAHAEVKMFGEFVPSECAFAEPSLATVIAVETVCVGRLFGTNETALRIYVSDGSQQTFAVKIERRTQGLGITKQRLTGTELDVESNGAKIEGVVTTINGIRRTQSIQIRTSDDLRFAGELEAVATTL